MKAAVRALDSCSMNAYVECEAGKDTMIAGLKFKQNIHVALGVKIVA